MNELWPRLSAAMALVEFDEIQRLVPSQLPSRTVHPDQTFAATGGVRIQPTAVLELVNRLEAVAEKSGYPHPATSEQRISFDRAAAEVLFRTTNMTSFEASQPGIWNFFALVAMPALTYWRFGIRNRERWIASDLARHMFSRLWWQAFAFGVPIDGTTTDYTLLASLTESDLNQLTERKSLGGNHRLVRTIARELQPIVENRRDIIRALASKIRRLTPFVDFTVLNDEQLRLAVHTLLEDSQPLTGTSQYPAPPQT